MRSSRDIPAARVADGDREGYSNRFDEGQPNETRVADGDREGYSNEHEARAKDAERVADGDREGYSNYIESGYVLLPEGSRWGSGGLQQQVRVCA